MKELAKNAEVSFATPFNLFGKKEDILAALFNRRVTEQAERSAKRAKQGSGLANLLQVGLDSCDGYLADAELFRPLAQSFRMQKSPELEAISVQAQAIWQQTLEDCVADGSVEAETDLHALARRLHISFRVTFLMWATDELSDVEFRQQVLFNTVACLLECITPTGRQRLDQLVASANTE